RLRPLDAVPSQRHCQCSRGKVHRDWLPRYGRGAGRDGHAAKWTRVRCAHAAGNGVKQFVFAVVYRGHDYRVGGRKERHFEAPFHALLPVIGTKFLRLLPVALGRADDLHVPLPDRSIGIVSTANRLYYYQCRLDYSVRTIRAAREPLGEENWNQLAWYWRRSAAGRRSHAHAPASHHGVGSSHPIDGVLEPRVVARSSTSHVTVTIVTNPTKRKL